MWARQGLKSASTVYDPTTGKVSWANPWRERNFPRYEQRSPPLPATEKLIWPPPPYISEALYGESNPTVNGDRLTIGNLRSFVTIQKEKRKQVEKLKELLDEAKPEPELQQVNTYGEGYGNVYGEKNGGTDYNPPDTMSFYTCSELCKPLLGADSDFKECRRLCSNIYHGNEMAARGGTKRRKSKRTKKKKTHRKKKRTRNTRKR